MMPEHVCYALIVVALVLTVRLVAGMLSLRRAMRRIKPPTITPYTGPLYNRHGREIK